MSLQREDFLLIPIGEAGVFVHDDGNFRTTLRTFTDTSALALPEGETHFGVVVSGEVSILHLGRKRIINDEDFFSVVGPAHFDSRGFGVIMSASKYLGQNLFGGPIENIGRLRYIDGCTDSLLIPPVKLGDPCLNHLHFPAGITQTPHTHPSARVGVILRGTGECVVPTASKPIELSANMAFIIRTNSLHSFNTHEHSLDVVAFHPDSDVGPTDNNHPMINRTMVSGKSAKNIRRIRTRT